jgi:triosephosphate isomerase
MARRKLIAANWKMHKTISEAETFALGLKDSLGGFSGCELALFPPFFAVPATARVLAGTGVIVGAQDLFWESQGAFTGEISGEMIIDAGGTHVIVGHSERRHVMGESNEIVAKKLRGALGVGLTAVFCVGERLEDREGGIEKAYVQEQLTTALSGIAPEQFGDIVVAYEPVWAIGTGRTATPEDAESMHQFIRTYIAGKFGAAAASSARILYGGSVKPSNARTLLERPDIDGALIGGASLDLASYVEIAHGAD